MEEFVKGSVVVFPFPFSDLTSEKKRPALIISTPGGNDIIVCQITSKSHNDKYCLELDKLDFEQGTLNRISYIRVNKIICIDKNIILYKIGQIKSELLIDVKD